MQRLLAKRLFTQINGVRGQLCSSLCSKPVKPVFLLWCFPFLLSLDSLSCFSNCSCLKWPLFSPPSPCPLTLSLFSVIWLQVDLKVIFKGESVFVLISWRRKLGHRDVLCGCVSLSFLLKKCRSHCIDHRTSGENTSQAHFGRKIFQGVFHQKR